MFNVIDTLYPSKPAMSGFKTYSHAKSWADTRNSYSGSPERYKAVNAKAPSEHGAEVLRLLGAI